MRTLIYEAVADLDEARAATLAAGLQDQGGEALAVTTDVSDRGQFERLVEQAVGRFGGIDVLFNNAGGNVPSTNFGDLTDEQWDSVVAVNLSGVFRVARGANEDRLRRRVTIIRRKVDPNVKKPRDDCHIGGYGGE